MKLKASNYSNTESPLNAFQIQNPATNNKIPVTANYSNSKRTKNIHKALSTGSTTNEYRFNVTRATKLVNNKNSETQTIYELTSLIDQLLNSDSKTQNINPESRTIIKSTINSFIHLTYNTSIFSSQSNISKQLNLKRFDNFTIL